MNCPDCKGVSVRVTKTVCEPGRNVRTRVCEACGTKWATAETVIKGSVIAYRAGHTEPLMATNAPPTAISGVGGVGGGVSSGSVPGLFPIPSGTLEAKSTEVVSKRSTEQEPVYPPEFSLIWEMTGRRGGKFAALKAWQKVGRPQWGAIEATWNAYMLSERPAKGYVKDLSSWLNGRCHQQEWPSASQQQGWGHMRGHG